jgi:hypothetical protein
MPAVVNFNAVSEIGRRWHIRERPKITCPFLHTITLPPGNAPEKQTKFAFALRGERGNDRPAAHQG